MSNPAICTDFYKVSHYNMFPKGTTKVYSNFTPRSDRLANKIDAAFDGRIVFFGLQGFIKEFLIKQWNEEFFQKPKDEVIAEYSRIVSNAVGPDAERDAKMAALHDLGYLPIEIKALPEGSLVDIKVPVLTVVNTHPDFYWLTNYFETVMSAELWKACTSATTAFQYRRLLNDAAKKTGGDVGFTLWQGHDFSYRGMSGTHDACVSGAGHLTSFLGTDTIPAIEYLEKNYRGRETFIAGSVPASEHSVTTSTIVYNVEQGMSQADAEKAFIREMIVNKYPSGIVSLVADSFDYWTVLTKIAPELKEEILARTPDALGNAKVVFRPDSGDPVDIICGTDHDIIYLENKSELSDFLMDACDGDRFRFEGVVYEVENLEDFKKEYSSDTYYQVERTVSGYMEQGLLRVIDVNADDPEVKGSIQVLWDTFGGTINEKGFKVLNPRVGLIYGDSITLQRAEQIMKRLEAKGFASTNVVFGVGSFTYQYNTRDSYGFAMKATYAEVNGKGIEVYKDPKTDSGTKKSARGLLRVEKENGRYKLYDRQTLDQEGKGELVTVFKDSKLVVEQSIAEIRDRISKQL